MNKGEGAGARGRRGLRILDALRESGDALEAAAPAFDITSRAASLHEAAVERELVVAYEVRHEEVTDPALEEHAPPFDVDAGEARLREAAAARRLLKPADALAAGSRQVKPGQVPVDVAIITILEEEHEAVYRLLKRPRRVTGTAEMGNQHTWVIGEIDAPDFDVPYTAVLAMSPRSGSNAAVVVTKNTLQTFDPHCVLVVGIAGGLGDLRLGDVVVADRICAYEYEKSGSEFFPRDDLDSPTDASIFSAAKTLAGRHPRWFSELEPSGEVGRRTPRIVIGHIASGDKVVDDPTNNFFASVVRSRPSVLAIEMEGAGAATAVQDVRDMQGGAAFGMIRGISDLPHRGGAALAGQRGKASQSQTRDSWKAPAAAAAAAAAVQLIRLSWPRPPRRAIR